MAFQDLSKIDELLPELTKLREVADETEGRRAASRKIELLDYDGGWGGNDDCFSPGTLALIMARPGSQKFRKLYDGIKEGAVDKALVDSIKDVYAKREFMKLPDAIALLKKQETVADLIGGRFTLISNIFVPEDLEVVLAPMPYNGGSIDGVTFNLVERFKSPDSASLDAFIVRRRPNLTAAEIAALRLVPPEAADLNVGRAMMCYAITGITIVGAVMAATYACPGLADEPHLSEDDLKQLGPELSARKLLQLRRKALERRL